MCRGYFGPNDRYDRIHAAALSPPSNKHRVLIVAGGVGCTPYLSILSQLVVDVPQINNVKFVLICRGSGLLEYLRSKLVMYADAGIDVEVYVTTVKNAAYLPVINNPNEGDVDDDTKTLVASKEEECAPRSEGFVHIGRVAVTPHPLMPGVARPSHSIKCFLSIVLLPGFWCASFYLTLKLVYYYNENVQSHHVVETRIWLPLVLVGCWAVAGIVLNTPFVKAALWGDSRDVVTGTGTPLTTPESSLESDEARSRSPSIERDLLRSSKGGFLELEGRPNFDLLTSAFQGDVFVCGPEKMKEDVRTSCGVSCCKDKKKRDWAPVLGKCGVRVWEEIFAW